MIYFETGRELDVRLYKTAHILDETFRSCGRYVLEDDRLIILGGIASIALSPLNREVSLEAPLRVFNLSKKKAKLLKVDSAAGRLIKMINDSYREWFEIDPFSNFMEFEGLVYETNRMMGEYGMTLVWNSQGLSLFHDSNRITFEQGLEFILDNDAYEDISKSFTEWMKEAAWYKSTGQDEKAMRRYEMILRYIDSSMEIYTEVLFSLGELYYFSSNYDEALIRYYHCDPRFIKDKRDFFVHIGHALLDRRMKNFESEIKIYYRSILDQTFYENNKRIVEYAATEIAQNYPEYEEACFMIGLRSFRENANRLIDSSRNERGLIVNERFYAPQAAVVKPKKRYEDIRLVQVKSLEDVAGKSCESMLAEGLKELNDGEYQKAYEAYVRLAEKAGRGSGHYTWAMLQLGKLFSFFDEYRSALMCLSECEPEKFGIVYRREDYMLLKVHANIVLDDFESDRRFRALVRGKYDHYFAKYDRDYHFMTRDRNLMEAFEKYQKECIENILNQ
ncbi:MAG: hypothetical protein IJR19_02285 [Lachnospiraceae bacterium]|nr:hypothetical protein [Lachnospiraceae bacterium]